MNEGSDSPRPAHWYRTNVGWTGSGRDGDPWQMCGYDLAECHCDQPWGHPYGTVA